MRMKKFALLCWRISTTIWSNPLKHSSRTIRKRKKKQSCFHRRRHHQGSKWLSVFASVGQPRYSLGYIAETYWTNPLSLGSEIGRCMWSKWAIILLLLYVRVTAWMYEMVCNSQNVLWLRHELVFVGQAQSTSMQVIHVAPSFNPQLATYQTNLPTFSPPRTQGLKLFEIDGPVLF